jgi:hypothetical protein
VTTRRGRLPTRDGRDGRRRNRPGARARTAATVAGLAWIWSAGPPVAAGEPDTAIAPGTGTRGEVWWIAAELVLLVGGAALACAWHGRRQRRRRDDLDPCPGADDPPRHGDGRAEPDAPPPDEVIDVRRPPDPVRGRILRGRTGLRRRSRHTRIRL